MLAYVFWHWPSPGVDAAAYAARLDTFQRALGPDTPSRTFALDRAPWDGPPAGPVYEDWYLVEDWGALGALNERAVHGAPLGPHDAVAALAADGAGGVYRLVRPGTALAEARAVFWHHKPRGVPSEAFAAGLGAGAVWQRQMVLGPAPEFGLMR
jgi:hypothetical protein